MKKMWLLLFIIMTFPFNVLAYADKIIPGGETLGIEVNTDGVMVIGFYEINGKFNRGTPNIKVGDYIVKINDIDINDIDELTSVIENNVSDKKVDVTVKRKGKLKNCTLDLIKDDDIYKTGLYVKDSITGIGTLSYIDPSTNIFGALGHEIIESKSNSIVEIKSGTIFRNYITSIDKSTNGYPGSKNAKFYYNTKYGEIYKNTNRGIFGKYDYELPDKELVSVAKKDEVVIGNAKIYTVLKDEEVGEFNIDITSINEEANVKNITFTINDEELINKTGGIVQGMSGSPILQNGKIIGVVTHVIIDNPLQGYGIFITNMLEEGEK